MKQSEKIMKMHKDFTVDIFSPKRTYATMISAMDSRISNTMPRIVATSLTYAPNLGETPVHYDDSFEIFYQHSYSDGCQYRLGSNAVNINPGDLILIPMGLRHRVQGISSDTRGIVMDFQKVFAGSEAMNIFFDCAYLHPWAHGGDLTKLVFNVPVESHHVIDDMAANIMQAFNDTKNAEKNRDPAALKKRSAVLSAEFKRFIRIVGRIFYSRCTPGELSLFEKYRPPMLAAINYMEKHFSKQIKLADICAATGFRVAWFSKIFREITGLSAIEYLSFIRTRHARELLVNTLLPINEIAKMCGYNSIYHFDRAFKAHTGCPPKVYRTEYIIESPMEK